MVQGKPIRVRGASRRTEVGHAGALGPTRMSSIGLAALTIAWVMVTSTPALAQDTSAAAPPAARGQGALPTDIVRLRNGGMARGTIIEVVPDDHVLLLLPDGETRRFDMAEVVYSGPIAAQGTASPTPAAGPTSEPTGPAPASTPVAGAAADDTVRLTLEASRSGISFYAAARVPNGSGHLSFQRLCEAPCQFNIAPGSYRMALSIAGESPVPTPRALHLTRDFTLEGTYHSRRGIRIGGWILFGLATPAAIGNFVALARCDGCSQKTALYGVAISLSVLALVGFVMGLIHDSARLDVRRVPTWARSQPAP